MKHESMWRMHSNKLQPHLFKLHMICRIVDYSQSTKKNIRGIRAHIHINVFLGGVHIVMLGTFLETML